MIKETDYQKLSKETDTSLCQNEPSLGKNTLADLKEKK